MDPLESFKAFVSAEVQKAKDEAQRLASIAAVKVLIAANEEVSEVLAKKLAELEKQ